MNIFVAKLDYGTTIDTVRELFSQFGEVTSAKIIMDKETGRSKGYGFVEMAEEEAGEEAIRSLNGMEVDGREILCKKSEPKENDRGGSGGGGFRKRFNRDDRGGGGGDRRRTDRYSGGGNNNNRDDRGGNRDRYDRNNRW